MRAHFQSELLASFYRACLVVVKRASNFDTRQVEVGGTFCKCWSVIGCMSAFLFYYQLKGIHFPSISCIVRPTPCKPHGKRKRGMIAEHVQMQCTVLLSCASFGLVPVRCVAYRTPNNMTKTVFSPRFKTCFLWCAPSSRIHFCLNGEVREDQSSHHAPRLLPAGSVASARSFVAPVAPSPPRMRMLLEMSDTIPPAAERPAPRPRRPPVEVREWVRAAPWKA